MAQVIATIAGRNYTLACRDGDESHLLELAAALDAKADTLTAQLGTMAEPRLLLMVALMVADELHELRRGKIPEPVHVQALPDPALLAWLEAMAERVEAMADRLEAPDSETIA